MLPKKLLFIYIKCVRIYILNLIGFVYFVKFMNEIFLMRSNHSCFCVCVYFLMRYFSIQIKKRYGFFYKKYKIIKILDNSLIIVNFMNSVKIIFSHNNTWFYFDHILLVYLHTFIIMSITKHT